MLEKPNIQEPKIIDCLKEQYGLTVVRLEFLPLGADVNTAVYRVDTENTPLYLKLRQGEFNEAAVSVPRILYDSGIKQVIAPKPNQNGQLIAKLDSLNLALYPFVQGENGFEVELTDKQWTEFGAVLAGIHKTQIPPKLKEGIPSETFSPKWRETVRAFLKRVETEDFREPTAVKLADFIKSKLSTIEQIVEQADELGFALNKQNLEFVLCHADIHAGNVLIETSGAFYVVDWDTLVFAPKERDLMFIGGGVGGVWNKPEEERLFYEGYGQTSVNPTAIAYFRYERIIEDIAAYCQQIFLTDRGGQDREQGFKFFTNQFLPNNVVDMAIKQRN